MRVRLAESGLTDAQAKLLGFEELSSAETQRLGSQDNRPSMRIPYFDDQGKRTSFFRVRYLGAPTGFAANLARPPRYWQPGGTLNEVYLPPLLKERWHAVLQDPTKTVYITEGEIKAAVACARGVACIGLGGVDVFRAAKRGMPELLPVLQEARWNQRPVAIIWDSDVGTKPDALTAQRKLAYELMRRGALPKLLALPPGPDGAKVGLDDFLLQHSVEALESLVEEAPVYEEAAALWSMNEEVLLIRYPPLLLERKTNEMLSVHDFLTVSYADRKYATRDSEGKVKTKPLAKAWLEWPGRFTLNHLTYAPGQPLVTEARDCNLWRGWGVESVKGDVTPFHDLLDHIFAGAEPGAREWFLKWAAYPLQHPGVKLFSGVLVWGVSHGTGKTLLGLTLKDIYGTNGGVIGDAEIHGSFNEWARNKQFIVGEEITGTDRRTDTNRLKALITQERVNINAKYMPLVTIPDCINYFFTSNEPNAFFLQDSDRRFFVHEVTSHPAPLRFYHEFDTWRFKRGGTAHLRYYLEHLDISDFNPKGPAFQTKAKRDMIVDNKSDLGRWVHDLKEDPHRTLMPLGNALAAEKCCLFTTTQLHTLFNPMGDFHRSTINGFARELKSAGFRRAYKDGLPVMTKQGNQKLWIVRNSEHWLKQGPKACAEHWDGFFHGGKF
jgi:hypothetical protein